MEDAELVQLIEDAEREKFQELRNENRREALKNIEKIQRENSKNYNKKRKQAQKYVVGDLVAIKRTQIGPGLKPADKFLGPYKVSRVLRKDRYQVTKVGDGEGSKSTSTSVDNMKPWRGHLEDLEEECETQHSDVSEVSGISERE